MKKLILLSILFIVGCPPPTEPEPEDCAGVAGGDAELDNCNVCDTDKTNDCVPDCSGVWGGSGLLDNCGVCDDDSTNDCVQDECGVWGGESSPNTGTCDCDVVPNGDAVEDECGVCGGDGIDVCGTCDGSLIPDCDGNCFWDYSFVVYLGNGQCTDGTPGGINLNCPFFDCDEGDCGDAVDDNGECSFVCDGYDCHGNCYKADLAGNDYSDWIGDGFCDDGAASQFSFACDAFDCDGGDCLDDCDVCCCHGYICDEEPARLCGLAGIVDPQGYNCPEVGGTACNCDGDCVDCAGVCGGNNELDECGICGGNGIPDGACDCNGSVFDCAGECGGSAVLDACGVCGGDGSGC